MGSKALKYMGIASLGAGVASGDPLTAIASGFGIKKLIDKGKSSSSTQDAAQTPKQGDVSDQEVNDVKKYTPFSTQENYGYGAATDANSLLKKRKPLGS